MTTRLEQLEFNDAGHGYDVLGFEPKAFLRGMRVAGFFYRNYFRVQSHGTEHIPRSGAAILVANHSGVLPIDAVMIVTDVFLHTDPPRVTRAIGDLFIPFMPWVGTEFCRMGLVSGTRWNFRHVLNEGALVLVFPEGTPGIGKGYDKRYELQNFRVGFAELALRHRVPVVPVAVIGAEESWAAIARIDSFHGFGAPFLPVPATPFPLPVRHHIWYGPPIWLHREHAASSSDDPEVIGKAVTRVRSAVQELIRRGLSEREGLYQ